RERFFFSSRRRHTRFDCDWSSDVCSSDLAPDRGITNPRVLAAMDRVPRHEFVPREGRRYAYSDGALAIGYGQTISQPFIVAFMRSEERRVGKVWRRRSTMALYEESTKVMN